MTAPIAMTAMMTKKITRGWYSVFGRGGRHEVTGLSLRLGLRVTE